MPSESAELAVPIGPDLVTPPECPARRRTREASHNAQAAQAGRVPLPPVPRIPVGETGRAPLGSSITPTVRRADRDGAVPSGGDPQEAARPDERYRAIQQHAYAGYRAIADRHLKQARPVGQGFGRWSGLGDTLDKAGQRPHAPAGSPGVPPSERSGPPLNEGLPLPQRAAGGHLRHVAREWLLSVITTNCTGRLGRLYSEPSERDAGIARTRPSRAWSDGVGLCEPRLA